MQRSPATSYKQHVPQMTWAKKYMLWHWPATSKLLVPLIAWLAHKASKDFCKSTQGIIKARMALEKDAKHNLYKLALSDKKGSGEGLLESEFWAEAVFFISAGKFFHG